MSERATPSPSALPTDVAEAIARAGDRVGPFADIRWYPQISSTNDVAATLAEAGAAEGTVVAADLQTAGRGRLGRVWVSPPGVGVYVSVVLRPELAVAPLVTIAAGIAIAEGVEAATGLSPQVKWPNDLVVTDGASPARARKLAGILAEGGRGASGPWVVLGFGINVLPGAYPPEVAGRATSIEGELGRPVDRGLVLAECLAALAARYAQLRGGGAAPIIAAWRQRAAATLGRAVEWDAPGGMHRGTAQDVDETGALLIATDTGVHRVTSGEVRWL